jgi:hypothetical protein
MATLSLYQSFRRADKQEKRAEQAEQRLDAELRRANALQTRADKARARVEKLRRRAADEVEGANILRRECMALLHELVALGARDPAWAPKSQSEHWAE